MAAMLAFAVAPPTPTRPVAPHQAEGPAASEPKVFVLPIKGSLGMECAQHWHLRDVAVEADKLGKGQTIVLEVDSPGGSVASLFRFSDVMSDVRKRHRVLVWVKQASGAAALLTLHSDANYWSPTGAIRPNPRIHVESVEPFSYEDFVADNYGRSGRKAVFASAMTGSEKGFWIGTNPKSGSKELVEGVPSATDAGAEVVAAPGSLPVFDASIALKCGLSKGTASDTNELAKLLGMKEWSEGSDIGRRLAAEWAALYTKCETELAELVKKLGAKESADGLRQMRDAMRKMLEWTKKCRACTDNHGIDPENFKRHIEEIERKLRGK